MNPPYAQNNGEGFSKTTTSSSVCFTKVRNIMNDNNILFSDVRYYIEPWINDLNTDSDYPIYRRLSEYTDSDGNYLNYHITW